MDLKVLPSSQCVFGVRLNVSPRTIGKLLKISKKELLGFRGIGRKSVSEIERTLSFLGLSLRQ